MKYIGIDFGSKKVGIAISDDGGTLAFPKVVLKNDEYLLSSIKDLFQQEIIDEIVIGESLTFGGDPNKIMKEILFFKETLQKELNVPIHMEKEFLTSVEARRPQGYGGQARRRQAKKKAAPAKKKAELVDASAAALILQRHLDKLEVKRQK